MKKSIRYEISGSRKVSQRTDIWKKLSLIHDAYEAGETTGQMIAKIIMLIESEKQESYLKGFIEGFAKKKSNF